jgi:hypothetical protein
MFSSPAVVVHGIDHARGALRPGLPVLLLSGPGIGVFAGCGWWRALIRAATGEFPGTPATDLLDCANAPGPAMAALRIGQRGLVLSGSCPGFAAVSAAAAALGAYVLADRPVALDLAVRGGGRRLEAWLRGDNPGLLR